MSPDAFAARASDADELPVRPVRASDGRTAALPTPEEIAATLYPGEGDEAGAVNRRCAAKGARAYRDAVCAALEAEADRIEAEWQRTGKGQRDHQVPLRAFAARLRGTP